LVRSVISGDAIEPVRAGGRESRATKYLPLVAALLLPLLVVEAFDRISSQSELAQMMVAESSSEGGRASRPRLPARVARPLTRRVFMIVLDAWRRQVALDDSKMPHLAALAHRGSRGIVLTGVRTFTKPSVRKLMTGLTSNLQDSALNLLNDPVAEESLLSRMNAAGYVYTLIDATPVFSGLFQQQCRLGSLITPSVQGKTWDSEDPAHDSAVEAACRPVLDDQRATFIMIHLEDLDLAGHIYGPGSDTYARVLRATDDRIFRLVSRLDLERDTLFVIGDHGSDVRGNHGGAEYSARETAYVAIGAGIQNANQPLDPLDAADTLAVLLGLCPPLDSMGAPNPELLAIGPRELKARCDRCLLDRLATLPGPTTQWLSTADAQRYFKEEVFTPSVADLYRRVANPLQAKHHSWKVLAVAILTIALGFFVLLLFRSESGANAFWIGAVVALALLPSRDAVGIVIYAVLLAFASLINLRRVSLVGCAAAAALLVGRFFETPTPFLNTVAGYAGSAALILGGCLLAPRVFKTSRARSVAPMVLTAVGASVAASLIPSYKGVFSPSVDLVDFALAAGCLFLILGLALRETAIVGLASVALAGCLFHGWPLLIFTLLEIFLQVRKPQVTGILAQAVLWAPVGMLALLRAENRGYGFGKIDLSLAVLGSRGDAVDYRWGAAIMLLAYLLPLLLAIRVSQTMAQQTLALNLGVVLSVLLIFCGADLLFIAVPGLGRLGSSPYEEVILFDVTLSALVCLFQALAMVYAFICRLRPASRPGLSSAAGSIDAVPKRP